LAKDKIAHIISVLSKKRFVLHDEKALQREVYNTLLHEIPKEFVEKEYVLDKDNSIDFLLYSCIGIEVKIMGAKRAIYRQCTRYCKFDQIASLLLVTNVSMGFPEQINGKDCYIIKLGKAWL
jgi:hypothetical protein